MDKQIQILCDQDDPNIKDITSKMSILNMAIENGTLVAIACRDEVLKEDKVLLAVMAKDEGEEFIQYSPIGTLFYEEDTSYTKLSPPKSALPIEDEDVKHSVEWLIRRMVKVASRISYHGRYWWVLVASAFPLSHHYRAALCHG